jgi:RNA polymerase sigma factor (sigma-70 family)
VPGLHSDFDIIQGIIHKDESAFRLLVEQYQDYVFRICLSFLKNNMEAEDLSQEVYIEVFHSASHFRQEAKLSTWIYKIALNKSINYLKKKKRSEWLNILDPLYNSKEKRKIEATTSYHADYDLEDSERNKFLYEAIDKLPANQRIAFTLNKIDEMSYQEIAEVMNTSLSSVESLIHRAKMNLQNRLYGYFKK